MSPIELSWTAKKTHIAHHSIHSFARLGVRAKAPVFVAVQCCGGINTQRKTGIIIISQNSRMISRVGQYKDNRNILETKKRNIFETKSEIMFHWKCCQIGFSSVFCFWE